MVKEWMEKKFARPITENFYEEDDLKKVSAHFSKFIGDFPCPVCKHNNWGLSRSLMTGTVFHLGQDKHWHKKVGLRIKGSCQNCGYIIELDAERAGVLPRRATAIDEDIEDS